MAVLVIMWGHGGMVDEARVSPDHPPKIRRAPADCVEFALRRLCNNVPGRLSRWPTSNAFGRSILLSWVAWRKHKGVASEDADTLFGRLEKRVRAALPAATDELVWGKMATRLILPGDWGDLDYRFSRRGRRVNTPPTARGFTRSGAAPGQ